MRAPCLLGLLFLSQVVLTICEDDTLTYLDSKLSYTEYQPSWPTTETQNILFEFRTFSSNALLMYNQYNNDEFAQTPYAMGIVLKNGRIQALHIYDSLFDIITLGKGMNDNSWHNVSLTKSVNGTLTLTVGRESQTLQLQSYALNDTQDEMTSNITSVYAGGLPADLNDFIGFRGEHFLGCIRNVKFPDSNGLNENITYTTTVLTTPGCIDKCDTENSCVNGKCINHYDGVKCDCYNSGFEGKYCEIEEVTELTYQGFNFIEYRIFNSSARQHKSSTRISLEFKVETEDQDAAILFYGLGVFPLRNYLAISLYAGTVNVTADFGDGPYYLSGGSNVKNKWRSLTVTHSGRSLTMEVDNEMNEVEITGDHYHLQLDPLVYYGGGPNLAGSPGLPTGRNFVGCMRSVYYNMDNLNEQLKKDDARIRHVGAEPIYGCNAIEFTPLTFPTFNSQLFLDLWQENEDLSLSFEFRTQQRNALVMVTVLNIRNTTSYAGTLKLKLAEGRMEVHLDISVNKKNDTVSYWTFSGHNLNDGKWHLCDLRMTLADGIVTMRLDNDEVYVVSNRKKVIQLGGFQPATDILLGAGLHNQERGFVGCIRRIVLQYIHINPLDTITSGAANGLLLDGCDMKDICAINNICEHDGYCVQDWYETLCDCEGTGYNGTVCHFPLYRRSCEEYYHMGKHRSGVWRIDPDGVGPIPPTYVHCDMHGDLGGGFSSTMTIDHNLAASTLVRQDKFRDLKKVLTYRGADEESLVYFVKHSINCSQTITYECYKSPLNLWDQTRFLSAGGLMFNEVEFSENCVSNIDKWQQDEAIVTKDTYLPITEMIFMQQLNSASTKAKVSLSSLKCSGSNIYDPKYAVTFRTDNGFLMLDAWDHGDISFNFRTLENNAVLLFQQPSRQSTEQLLIELIDGSSVDFTFDTGSREANLTVPTLPLNDGNWHKIWIEYDAYHVRFTVDMISTWFQLMEGEIFGPFGGPLFIGGMGGGYFRITPGFIGCIRGLSINEEIIPLQDYITNDNSSAGIEAGCHRSCDPNPCVNGGLCSEMWGSYICMCADISHRGQNCEENYLDDMVTFPNKETIMKIDAVDDSSLTSDIRFEFRTRQWDLLILYANDYLGNFIQLSFLRGNRLQLKFNSDQSINVLQIFTEQDIRNGEWQRIQVIRNHGQTSLYLNDEVAHIQTPLVLLDDYIPIESRFTNPSLIDVWPEFEINTNSTPYTYVYIGGVRQNMTDPLNVNTQGMEGCMRAVFVDEVPFSLVAETENNAGVFPFCTPFCTPSACKHGGICKEKWNSFECDCSKTLLYRGAQCEIDIGAYFQPNMYLLYEFNPFNSTYIQPPGANDPAYDEMDFAFIANNTYGVMAYVRGDIYDDEFQYIIVELTKDGYVFVHINLGYGQETFLAPLPGPYNDGKRHWFYYRRRERRIVIDIDNTAKEIMDLMVDEDKALFDNRDAIVIGGVENELIRQPLKSFSNFSGCISEFQYNGIQPIKIALGLEGNDPTIVDVEGDLLEASCTVIRPTTAPFSFATDQSTTSMMPPTEMFTYPPWNVGAASTVYLSSPQAVAPEAQTADSSSSTVVLAFMVIVAVVLLVAIICTAFQINKEEQKKKEGYQNVPMTEMENGTRQPIRDKDAIRKEDLNKPSHTIVRELPEEKVPLKEEPWAVDNLSDSDDDILPHRRPLQVGEEEMEWDPVADTTLVADDPNLSPVTRQRDKTPTEDKEPLLNFDDIPMADDNIQEPDLEWDDEMTPPHERPVSYDLPQQDEDTDEDEVKEEVIKQKDENEEDDDKPKETTSLNVVQDDVAQQDDDSDSQETTPLVPPKTSVSYENLEDDDSDNEIDNEPKQKLIESESGEESDKEPEPEPESEEQQPQLEPESEPKPEQQPESVPEPKPKQESGPESRPQPEPEPQLEPDPQPQLEPEPILQPQQEPGTEPQPKSEPQKPEPEPQPVIEPEIQTHLEPELEWEPDPGFQPAPERKPDSEDDDEMVQGEIVSPEKLPPEHTSKIAELKTQEGVPDELQTNGMPFDSVFDDNDNPAKVADVIPGEPEDSEPTPQISSPQRKKKKRRTSRRGSEISQQSQS
ncbi:axotactin-like [Saccoglossus kowalevskii]|uniref:Neurexin-3b-like n=1 Tax=Saccoglossus kowalevskii TaxID=10224 RepID=A0ABM0GY72_SACKO|nr:PREDICTED: neurexin-3b-like [Saccoglossus kowalevskii]